MQLTCQYPSEERAVYFYRSFKYDKPADAIKFARIERKEEKLKDAFNENHIL